MNLITQFLIFILLIWSCQNEQTKDLTPILEEYQESIRSINEGELNRARYIMDKCGDDSIVNKFKEAIQIINKIGGKYSLRINKITNVEEIKSLYLAYGDSLKNIFILKELSLKAPKLIKLGEVNDYTISELKIITRINLILYEKKIREEILGSISIDCP